jgi:hypothetical protein
LYSVEMRSWVRFQKVRIPDHDAALISISRSIGERSRCLQSLGYIELDVDVMSVDESMLAPVGCATSGL